jgi:hypothetical protein
MGTNIAAASVVEIADLVVEIGELEGVQRSVRVLLQDEQVQDPE